MNGKKLKDARIDKGMTAEEVASLALVSVKTVYNAENGKSVNISTAKRICKVLGLSHRDLRNGNNLH